MELESLEDMKDHNAMRTAADSVWAKDSPILIDSAPAACMGKQIAEMSLSW